MRKDTRNSLAAYLLFIYGVIFLPVLLISFQSAAYGVNLFVVFGFTFIVAFACSMLFYNFKTRMHFPKRIFIYWSFITLIIVFVWLVICEGTFIIRE